MQTQNQTSNLKVIFPIPNQNDLTCNFFSTKYAWTNYILFAMRLDFFGFFGKFVKHHYTQLIPMFLHTELSTLSFIGQLSCAVWKFTDY
jgi:hypothetical protein